jgi:uncharacterized protein (TIGR02271 family)
MLCAEVDGDEDADRIVAILEETPSVDLDTRQQSWRNEGWQPYSAGTERPAAQTFSSGARPAGSTGNAIEEERIPIVEEELKIGKREVARGGARVRSYIVEQPVREQISLREEHVSVERRPVDQTLRAGQLGDSDLLRERTIEMTEMSEEAVVAKEAKVREELVVKKTAEQRTETVEDTVRRTEVEVDEGRSGSQDRAAFGSFGRDSGTAQRSGTSGLGESNTEFEKTNKDRF